MPPPRCFLASLLLVFTVSCAVAEVKLPAVFSDNLVLQQGRAVPVWGWAAPGEEVTVTLGERTAAATADAEGRWQVALGPLAAGGPQELVVQGENTLTLRNVLVGEVWIASGQSNMEWVVANSNNAREEIAAADFPLIRMFTVTKNISAEPRSDCAGAWAVCSPETVGRFSAVGYFFARELHEARGVPVGIVHTSWGGTPAQSWTDRQSFLDYPAIRPLLEQTDAALANYSRALGEAVRPWLPHLDAALAQGGAVPLPPTLPADPRQAHMPTGLYNAMIAPLVPYAIAGAIWYQGESNAGNPGQYQTLFPAMIQGWRRAWGQGDFPFLFVQLANFMAVRPEPSESNWAALREAQTMTLRLPSTGMAVAIDIGEANDIHPRNKQDVGRRLTLAARHVAYGEELVWSGPLYESMTVEENRARLRFRHVGGGLVAAGEGPLQRFAVAGEDGRFAWAEAQIEGDTVVVSSPQVARPVAVRYAWADNPLCNLYNAEGLPAVPFRTDAPQPPEI